MSIDKLLASRESSHGDYYEKASYIQNLKTFTEKAPNWKSLSPDKKESLDSIFQKVGRIMYGDSNFKDHWDDISGYSALISKELEGSVNNED